MNFAHLNLLRDELTADPLTLGYAAHIASGSHATVASMLNERQFEHVFGRFITARTILAELPLAQGSIIINKLAAIAKIDAVVGVAWTFLNTEGGFDVGHPSARAAIDSLVNDQGGLTIAEADALKSLARAPAASRWEVLTGEYGARVAHADVTLALGEL